MAKFDALGLTDRLVSVNSLSNSEPQIMGVDFDLKYEVQARAIRSGRTMITNFTANSSVGSALGTLADGLSLTLTTTLTPSAPYLNQVMFGIPMVTAYLGSSEVGSNMIFPRSGSGIANNKYDLTGGMDYSSTNGTNLVYKLNLENNSGAAGTFLFVTQWRYVDYNIGTGSRS